VENYYGIGIMSGTSLDGLDLAYCMFSNSDGKWSFSIEIAETIPYSDSWREKLLTLHMASPAEIENADLALGEYIGLKVRDFMKNNRLKADFVASHGHTVLHKPEEKLTLQIGDGKRIAGHCGIPVVNDFRSSDVAMGGQGAPLVPIGDRFLFAEFEYCLNLGGIANISFEDDGNRIAFDISPANMVLNHLAAQANKPYDDKGAMAAKGELVQEMLEQLEGLPYYKMTGPRSLGREWVEEHIFPLLNDYRNHSIPDLLATFSEHIALRLAAVLNRKGSRMLVTGGGAYNEHLISRMKHHCDVDIILPEKKIIDYKEAMVFAFLGLLRLKKINNVLGSVTGAPEDHCAGVIFRSGK